MRIASAPGVASAPNVTPMIDVMLVLLIIFMVVAPALLAGPVAEPPKAANLQPRPEDSKDHTLAIDVNGRYFLDRRPVPAESLGGILASIYRARNLNRVLYLRAHKELEYRQVLAAIDVARSNGVVVVGMISERKQP